MPFLPFFSFLRKKTSPGSLLSSSSLVTPTPKVASTKRADCEPKKPVTARNVADAVRVISGANWLSTPSTVIRWSAEKVAAAWATLPNPILLAYVRACVAKNQSIELASEGANYKTWLAKLQAKAEANFQIVIDAILMGAELPASALVTQVIAEAAAETMKNPHELEFSPRGAVFQKVHIVGPHGQVLFLCANQRDAFSLELQLPAEEYPDVPDVLPRKIARETLAMSNWNWEDGWYVPKKKHNGFLKKSTGNSSHVTIKRPSQKTKI